MSTHWKPARAKPIKRQPPQALGMLAFQVFTPPDIVGPIGPTRSEAPPAPAGARCVDCRKRPPVPHHDRCQSCILDRLEAQSRRPPPQPSPEPPAGGTTAGVCEQCRGPCGITRSVCLVCQAEAGVGR